MWIIILNVHQIYARSRTSAVPVLIVVNTAWKRGNMGIPLHRRRRFRVPTEECDFLIGVVVVEMLFNLRLNCNPG